MGNVRKRKNETINEFNERATKHYYNEGYHIVEIAEKLKIDVNEVYNYIVVSRPRVTTEKERAEMIKLYNLGYTYSAIGRLLNRSRTCVRERIQSPAKCRCRRYISVSNKQIPKIKEMIKNGATIKTISESTGISENSIKCRISHTNINSARACSKVTKSEINRFIELYNDGNSCYKIAKICKRGETTVRRHLRRVGVYK